MQEWGFVGARELCGVLPKVRLFQKQSGSYFGWGLYLVGGQQLTLRREKCVNKGRGHGNRHGETGLVSTEGVTQEVDEE